MEPELVGKRVEQLRKEQEISIKELAQKMQLTEEVLQKKLKGEEEFYLDEMEMIKDIFKLDIKDCDELFFQGDKNIEGNIILK